MKNTKNFEKFKNIKVCSFDFDGVFVLDSEAVFKKEAWGIALASYAGRYEPLLKEGNSMFGSGKPGGRMEILRHVFQGLGEPADTIDVRVMEAAHAFDEYVQTKILEAGLVPGAHEMLQNLSGRKISMYLNSGTSTPALALSARNLKIDHFFREVLGSTKEPIGGSKVHNLLFMKKKENVASHEILFIGDGDSDVKAAQEFRCQFLGVSNRWNNWKEEEKPFPLVTNLQDMPSYL